MDSNNPTYHILHPPQAFNHACQWASTTITIAIHQEACIGVLLVAMISYTRMKKSSVRNKMQLWMMIAYVRINSSGVH